MTHIDNAREFVRRARAIQEIPQRQQFKTTEVIELANKYNLMGAFYATEKKGEEILVGHQLLVTGAKEGQIRFYDPIQGVLIRNVDDLNGQITVTRDLVDILGNAPNFEDVFGHFGMVPAKNVQGELERVRYLVDGTQHLGRIQENSIDCGPLSVYAAVVGNHHSQQMVNGCINFPDWEGLERDLGIDRKKL